MGRVPPQLPSRRDACLGDPGGASGYPPDPWHGLVRGELETQVMDVVWNAEGPVTPGQVHDELRRTRKLAYTTAMTILVRLYRKGLLRAGAAGRIRLPASRPATSGPQSG